jgi:hypothetical protein
VTCKCSRSGIQAARINPYCDSVGARPPIAASRGRAAGSPELPQSRRRLCWGVSLFKSPGQFGYKTPVPTDTTVRPFFRVIGAVFLAAIALLYVYRAARLVEASTVLPEKCDSIRVLSRMLCSASNGVLEVLPSSLQGPSSALAAIAFAILLLAGSWWLLKPLAICVAKRFIRRRA